MLKIALFQPNLSNLPGGMQQWHVRCNHQQLGSMGGLARESSLGAHPRFRHAGHMELSITARLNSEPDPNIL
eukprot:1161361-Pelagomonas_calceolata.AAC.12